MLYVFWKNIAFINLPEKSIGSPKNYLRFKENLHWTVGEWRKDGQDN